MANRRESIESSGQERPMAGGGGSTEGQPGVIPNNLFSAHPQALSLQLQVECVLPTAKAVFDDGQNQVFSF